MLIAPPTMRNGSSAIGVGLSLVVLFACLLATPSAAFAQGNKKLRVPLQSLTAETLHHRLQKVLRRQIATSQDPTGTWLGFHIDQAAGPPVTVWASTKEKQAELSGPPQLVDSWQKVLMLMDTPATDTNVTELVATTPASQVKVRKAVKAIQAAQPINNQPAQSQPPPRVGPQLGAAADSVEPQSDSLAVSLLGPVQIDVVDGTDILLLRGNPRDVQRVLDVIDDIEKMSEVGEPEVEVVQLQHVESQTLAVLLKQIFSENNAKYGYGSVGVYPLARPNSILLIALPTTMQRAKETLAKLDQPGKEATQFETFALKHAKASDAVTIVQNLFSATETEDGTTSLAPKAQVIADSRTNSLIVRASPRDLEEVRELIAQIDLLGSQAVNELRIFRLSSAVATDLEDVLQEAFQIDPNDDDASGLSHLLRLVTIDAEGRRQLESGVLANAQVTGVSSANALIVAAPAESMPLLESLIEQLDQGPNAAIELKIFPLENGDAASLVDTLTELFSTGDGDDDEQITRLRVEVDERTNSILAAGTRDDLVTVEAIIRTLDSTEGRDRENRVYRLRHKFAFDLAQALNQMLQAERDVQSTAPGTVSPFEQLEREVIVVNEDSSNSLLVSTSPDYFERVDKLIAELDVREEMVMIQVLIAEVELGDTDEFGVELGLQDSVLFDRSVLTDIERSTRVTTVTDAGGGTTVFNDQVIDTAGLIPGFNFGNPGEGLPNAGSTSSLATAGRVAGQALSSFAMQRVSSEAGFGGLVLSASSDSVSMLLRALQESRRLEVLSRPQIMALNNQDGSTFVGQLVPFITRSEPNAITGQPINTVERVEVGLSLAVRPRISPDGLVVLNITATNNRLRPLNEGVPVAISPNGDPILQPIQDAIQATTVVSAMSGQTVILSGLITKEDNALHRRVPILADVPLLGDLFRFDSVATQRRELLIVMTPHVVKSRFESEMLKQIESARMNWCLSDVVEMHGPAGLRSQGDRNGIAEAEVVYPSHVAPEELLPSGTMSPQPELAAPQSPLYLPTPKGASEVMPVPPQSP